MKNQALSIPGGRVHQPTLGVVAISFNEERDLPAFLDHLVPWVDEIVIVDDGSEDQTRTIASRYPDKVTFIVAPRGSNEFFSHQRNKGIDAADSDWLLHMDVDERVTPELAREIVSAISRDDCDAYRFRRLNFFLHRLMRGGGWQRWNQIHLARREVLRFSGMYHEYCRVGAPVDRVGQLENLMWHLNDADYLERMEKSNRYCVEVAQRISRKGRSVGPIQLLLRPVLLFGKRFILERGFLDGTAGMISALHSATAEFRALAIVWDEQHPVDRSTLENRIGEMWRHASKTSGSTSVKRNSIEK
jgi:glycosyltransferase involved in cell wall biosynthesis